MSKLYRNKTCVYCRERRSITADHVFAREFFPLIERGGLPKVPACAHCNRLKSVAEHYLTALLPFGGQHRSAAVDLATMIPPRLGKNAKLRRTLAAGKRDIWMKTPAGVILPSMSLPFDHEKLTAWAGYVAMGLMWHHWKLLVPLDHDIAPICLTRAGEQALAALFVSRAVDTISGTVGDGRFAYRGVRGEDATYWEILPMGGLMLAGDPHQPDEISTRLGVLTGPKTLRLSSFRGAPRLAE